MRQQHHQTAHPAPFLLAGGDELVNHYPPRAVGKIAKLRFPDSQGYVWFPPWHNRIQKPVPLLQTAQI